jgi:hypothetical protein
MPHTLITPSLIARQAWANLLEDTVLTALVFRDYEADFQGQQGDTITVRKPGTFVAKEFNRANGIELQNLTETSFPVVLDHLLDVSFAITSEELTLDIVEFNERFIVPATDALVHKVEALLLSLRAQLTQSVGAGTGVHLWSNPRVLLDARKILNKNNVPQGDRYAVVGPNIGSAWLADPLFNEADKRGDTDGLREAEIGRKFGFENYEVSEISGTLEEGIAFHRTAIALVARALAAPSAKTADAASFGAEGIGIRVVKDYDINHKQDVISLDLLCGVKVLDDKRAVVIEQQAD